MFFKLKEPILITLLLVFCVGLTYNSCNQKKLIKTSLKNINSLTDSITYYKNKVGDIAARKKVIELSLKEAKKLDIINKIKIKKLNNLVSSTKIKSTTKDSLVIKIKEIYINDSTKAKIFDYKDKWLKLNGVLSDSLRVNYKIHEEFEVNIVKDRPRIFKPKVLVVDVWSKNPNSLVSNIQSIQIVEPKKKFYETKFFAFTIGFLTYSIIK